MNNSKIINICPIFKYYLKQICYNTYGEIWVEKNAGDTYEKKNI